MNEAGGVRACGQRAALLAEFDRTQVVATMSCLRHAGWHAVHAADADAAFRASLAGGYDVMLVDAGCEMADGRSLVLEMLEHWGEIPIPIVLLGRDHAVEHVAVATLHKPYSCSSLLRALERSQDAVRTLRDLPFVDGGLLHDRWRPADAALLVSVVSLTRQELVSLQASMETAIDAAHRGAIRQAAHQLFGLASNVAALRIANLACQLERAALTAPLPTLHALIGRIGPVTRKTLDALNQLRVFPAADEA